MKAGHLLMVGRVFLLVVVLVVGSGWGAAGAAPVTPRDAELAALPPELASLGASEAWWGAVQSHIRQDIAQAGGARQINGLSTDPDWSRPGESAPDHFGFSVASAGDVNGDGLADVIVGAHIFDTNRGKAYAFYQTASGLETTPNWTATGEQGTDEFGCSVAGAGDVNGDGYSDVIVGANKYPDGGKRGRAYVFLGGGSGLNNSPITPLDGEGNGDEFGGSVAGAGDVNGDGYADVIVGARFFDEEALLKAGKVTLYLGGANGPGNHGERTLVGDAAGDEFGSAVAGAGDVDGDGYADVIIGAEGTSSFAGEVHVYYGSDRGFDRQREWSYSATAGDHVGAAVAGAGDVNGDGYADVIFGAPNYRDEDASFPEFRGAAWVMYGGENGLRESGWDWFKIGETLQDRYGTSVAGAGDVNGDGYADILVGAPGYGGSNHGKAYLHRGSANGVVNDPAWDDEGETNWDQFGASVAGAGDVNGDGYADVAVGADGFANGAATGKAYIYYGAGDLPSAPADDWNEQGDSSGDRFSRMAGAGDVNGDGYADVVVGASHINGGQGRVYVYFGSSDGLPQFADWDDDGEQAGSWFGRWVAGAGDVNGDGYGDILVGAFGYDLSGEPGDAEAGRAYLYYGRANGLRPDPVVVGTGEAGGDHYGVRVAGAGDVNGDGYADIMVSSDRHNNRTGKVYVYYGSENGPNPWANRELEGDAPYEYFGFSLAGAGDLNGDGYGDIVVGAYGAPGGEFGGVDKGKVEAYTGSATGLGTGDAWTLEGETNGDRFGTSVAGVGDVNGDGYSDLFVGAPSFESGRGKVYFYDFRETGVSASATWSARAFMAQPDAFGHSVAGAGDLNGDGFADLLVGANLDSGNADRSYAVAFMGPRTGSSPLLGEWGVNAEAAGDEFGSVVAGGGDLNGDGYADILVSSEKRGGEAGKVYAYFGNDGGGRKVLSRQRGQDGMEIQPWGLADAPDEFHATLWASDPAGRGSLKVEVEACPPGVPFDDNDCQTAVTPTWHDLFGAGTPATQRRIQTRVRGLDELTLYRWRARVLYAPLTVTEEGIIAPAKPPHGPWRRFLGQGFEADLRTAPCDYGLEVTPPRDTESDYPGERVFYTLRLVNTGTCRDMADVTVSPEPWTTDLPPTVGPLAPGEGSDVHIKVDIPAGAGVGDSNLDTLTFTSQGDATKSDSSELTTNVIGRSVYLPMVLKDKH